MFGTGKLFQPSLVFVRKAGAYPSGATKRGSKGLPVTNTLAYYELVNYGHKKFYNIGPRLKKFWQKRTQIKKVL